MNQRNTADLKGTFDTELGHQGSRFVVNASVDHARVVAALVGRELRLLLHQGHGQLLKCDFELLSDPNIIARTWCLTRVSVRELLGGGQTDDPAADDDDIERGVAAAAAAAAGGRRVPRPTISVCRSVGNGKCPLRREELSPNECPGARGNEDRFQHVALISFNSESS